MFYTEGLQHLFELATGQQSRPSEYYVGWMTNDLLAANATMVDVAELSGNGYGRKRVAPGQAAAEGTLTLDEQVSDDDTMTVDTVTYRFKDTPAQAEDIQIGASLADTQANIVATINGSGSAGVEYFTGTTSPHTTVEMDSFDGDDQAVLTARTVGSAGNSIITTETFTIDSGGSNGFDAATLGTTRAGGWELTSALGGVNGRTLTTRSVMFTAAGGNWDLAMHAFLTTTPTGTAGPLIASEEINDGDGISLSDGQSYNTSLVLLAQPGT